MSHRKFHDDMRPTLQRLRSELFYIPLEDERENARFLIHPLTGARWLLPAIAALYHLKGDDAITRSVISLRESHIRSDALTVAVAELLNLTDPASGYKPNEMMLEAARVPTEFYQAVVNGLRSWPVAPCRMHRENPFYGTFESRWWISHHASPHTRSGSTDSRTFRLMLFLHGLNATLTSTEWQLVNPLEKF